jgi:hypothetical protein
MAQGEIAVDADAVAAAVQRLVTASESTHEAFVTVQGDAVGACVAVPPELAAFQSAFEEFGLSLERAMKDSTLIVDHVRGQVQLTAEQFGALDRETATDLRAVQQTAEQVAPDYYAATTPDPTPAAAPGQGGSPLDGSSAPAPATGVPASADARQSSTPAAF